MLTGLKRTTAVLLGATAMFATISCSDVMSQESPKADIGTVLGAIVGGLGGSQVGKGSGQLWATGAGVFLGAILGRGIGESLDRADQMYAQQSYQYTLESVPTGYTEQWMNPDSGHSGTYTPTHTYQAPSGQYCREFQQTVTIGGRTEEAYGTACRQPDGAWKITQDTSAGYQNSYTPSYNYNTSPTRRCYFSDGSSSDNPYDCKAVGASMY